ncbi:MAG: hypothetical protein K2G52_13465 [Muribaculaceae bacterium]|nr:hypothetical protein [Muribaculaceae bacterium]
MKTKRYLTAMFIAILHLNATPSVKADTIPDNHVIELNEIIVKADNIVRTKDGMVIRPDAYQTKHSSGGYDLIRNLMIPGVIVNIENNDISALGSQAALFIDGNPAEYREVKQLRPSDVLKVEYFESPTGKYAGNNVVINFVMRKRDSGGYVALDALQRMGYTQGDYNLSSKYYNGNTQYTLFGGYEFSRINNEESYRNEEIRFPDNIITRLLSSSSDKKTDSQYAQFRIRNKNDRRTLRATFNFIRDVQPHDDHISSIHYIGGQFDKNDIESKKLSSSRSFKYSLGLSGSFNLPDGNFLEVSAAATANRNDYTYSYMEEVDDFNSSTVEDYYNFNAAATFVKTFAHGNSLIFKGNEFYNITSANYYGIHGSRQHLWSSETLFFCQYSHPIGKKISLQVAPGLSMQFYRLHKHNLKQYYSPRLQGVVIFQPTRTQRAQLVALVGNSFPQLGLMTEAVQQVDLLQQRKGNPDLKQTGIANFMGVYGIGIGKFNLQLSGIMWHSWRLPVSHFYIEDDMLVESYLPHGKWNQYDINLSASWNPSSIFNLQVSGGYLANKYFHATHVSAASWKGSAQAAYYFGDFSLNANLETPHKTAGYDLKVTKTPWLYGLHVSWSKKGLHLGAGVNNFFQTDSKYHTRLDTGIYKYMETAASHLSSLSAYLKIGWSIDYGKKTKHDTRDIDKNIQSGILKAN